LKISKSIIEGDVKMKLEMKTPLVREQEDLTKYMTPKIKKLLLKEKKKKEIANGGKNIGKPLKHFPKTKMSPILKQLNETGFAHLTKNKNGKMIITPNTWWQRTHKYTFERADIQEKIRNMKNGIQPKKKAEYKFSEEWAQKLIAKMKEKNGKISVKEIIQEMPGFHNYTRTYIGTMRELEKKGVIKKEFPVKRSNWEPKFVWALVGGL
jgi:hypothetical protein